MGFFSTLFGSAKKKQISEEINISEATAAHVSWKLRLQRCLDGTAEEKLDPEIVCRDDACKLGQWIHGDARKHFEGVEAFYALRADHATFHQLAGKIVSHVHSNEHAAARQLMDGEYRNISRKVVMTLSELNNELVS